MSRLDKLAAKCRKNNIEVFYVDGRSARQYTAQAKHEDTRLADKGKRCRAGWYWWSCSPGCIPDSDSAFGPYTSETRACEGALDGIDEE